MDFHKKIQQRLFKRSELPAHRPSTPSRQFKNETESSYAKKLNEYCDKIILILAKKNKYDRDRNKLIRYIKGSKTQEIENSQDIAKLILTKSGLTRIKKAGYELINQLSALIATFTLNIIPTFFSEKSCPQFRRHCLNRFFTESEPTSLSKWEKRFIEIYKGPNHQQFRIDQLSRLLESFPLIHIQHIGIKTKTLDKKLAPKPIEIPLDKSDKIRLEKYLATTLRRH